MQQILPTFSPALDTLVGKVYFHRVRDLIEEVLDLRVLAAAVRPFDDDEMAFVVVVVVVVIN